MGGAAVMVGRKLLGKHSLLSQTHQIYEQPQVCERHRGRMSVRGRQGRRSRAEGGRPSVYSQCCDMFVMFSHRGDSQTACFHFTVWHLATTRVTRCPEIFITVPTY